jgi:hypothetical protein
MAGMARPKFTLHTLFIAVSYIAVACALFRFTLYNEWLSAGGLPCYIMGAASFGAGMGSLFRRQLVGALIAVIASTVLFWIVFTMLHPGGE